MKAFILVILLLFTVTALQSQEVNSGKFPLLGVRVHYGSMIIHSRALKDIGNAYPFGVDLSIISQSTGKKAWESCNCYPRRGLTLSFWNFDKPEILGNGYTLNAFIEPMFGGWNRFTLSLKAATGVGYLTKPYHPETNPYNFSYSTRISFVSHLGGTLNYSLSDRIILNFTLIYNHTSNGGFREPNKGINWPTLALGMDYKPTPFVLVKNEKQRFEQGDDERNSLNLHLFGTLKQLSHEQFTKYFIGGFMLNGARRISRLSALTVGGEFEWDESDREEISRITDLKADHKKAGLMAGHYFLLGRFLFSQSIGVYLYDQYKANDPVYQMYGLTYKTNGRFFLGVRLKAHRHVADFIALEAGVRLI